MEAEIVKASFIKRYLIAISLVAALSVMAFYFLSLALKASDSTALIVNISGKQRMLSQRIASLSQQYYLKTYINKNQVDSQAIKQKLADLIIEISSANKALSSGEIIKGTHLKLSPSIKEYYFGTLQLNNRVDAYVNISKNIISFSTQNETLLALEELLKTSEELLLILNNVVLQYQIEGEENIIKIKSFEVLVLVSTLVVLMLEIIFIFQPMASRISELFQKVNYHAKNLEQEVEIRTLSLKLANEKLSELASHDPLTGLKNRLNLENELESLLTHYKKYHIPFAVVMFDIDWFKKINDSHGHNIGDLILKELSQILSSSIRSEDSAYRVGGEEFVIVFNRISLQEVSEKVNQIRLKVKAHNFEIGGSNLNITISGGIYHPEKIELSDIKMIMKVVDDALYKSKRAGRNQFTVAESNITDILS